MTPRQIPWRWLLIGVAALLLIMLAVLPQQFSDSSKLGNRVADALATWSGGSVKLTGPLRVRYFPDVSIRSGFELSNASRFPLVKSIRAMEVRMAIDLVDLLRGRISIDAMRLLKPEITLKETPSLKMGPDQTLEAQVGNLLSAAPVGVIRVRDGAIRFDDARKDAIEKIDARFDISAGGGAMSSFGSFTLRDERVGFTLESSSASIGNDGLRIPFSLSLNAQPVTVRASGTASFTSGLQLDGNLRADMNSVRAFLKWTGISLPDGQSLQRLSVAGPAHWNGTTLSFDEGSYSLDGNDAVGVLAVTPGTRPRFEGTLAFERLALDPYVGGDSSTKAKISALVKDPLLKYFDADLRISAAEITAPAMRLGRGGFTISANSGLLSSEVGEIELCGGSAAGRIGLDVSKEIRKAAFTASLFDVPIGNCLQAFATGLSVSGIGRLKADMTAEGRNYDELAESLAGTLRFRAQNGSIPVDLARLLTSASPFEGPGWSRNNVTFFDELTANCRLGGGHIACDTFNMRTGRGMISGTGQVDLARQTLDWSLFLANQAAPISAAQLEAATPPRISVSGSLAQPMIRRADRQSFGEGSAQTKPAASQIAPQ